MTPPPPSPSSRRLGARMIIITWVLILGLLTVYFSGWYDRAENPNANVVASIGASGRYEVVLEQNRQGHYVASGTINGGPAEFLLDTGATDVSVPASVAERLSLQRGRPVRARTANGSVTVYATRLDSVELGGIELRDVRASINPHMEGDSVLLGMAFLRHLDLLQQGRRLTLRVPERSG